MKSNLEGIHYQTQKPIRVTFEQGSIQEVVELENCSSTNLIAPGLVDLQINGFNGIDFNEKLQFPEVVQVTQSLQKMGVTSYFPTLITNRETYIEHALGIIVRACKTDDIINQSIRGIHLEGPFISKEDGPRGAHPARFIQAPNWELFKSWQEVAEGRIKLITMAPELEGAIEFIEKCVDSGVQVAIGHTAANTSQINDAVQAGARLSTHLGNAAHPILPRHPNYLWDQLASDKLWISMIADGIHLPIEVLKVFMKVKRNMAFLVSDATRFAGLPPGIYQSPIGGEVVLDENGRLYMKNFPELLAGSASSLLDCIQFLVQNKLISLGEAIEMASIKPCEFLGESIPHGLVSGAKADLIEMDHSGKDLKILQTIKSGELLFSQYKS